MILHFDRFAPSNFILTQLQPSLLLAVELNTGEEHR